MWADLSGLQNGSDLQRGLAAVLVWRSRPKHVAQQKASHSPWALAPDQRGHVEGTSVDVRTAGPMGSNAQRNR